MAEVATPGIPAGGAVNQSGQEPTAATGRAKREKVTGDIESKREPLPADEFTKATFTAAQKLLREQRSSLPSFPCACKAPLVSTAGLQCCLRFLSPYSFSAISLP